MWLTLWITISRLWITLRGRELFEGVGVTPNIIATQNRKTIDDDVLNLAIGPIQ